MCPAWCPLAIFSCKTPGALQPDFACVRLDVRRVLGLE